MRLRDMKYRILMAPPGVLRPIPRHELTSRLLDVGHAGCADYMSTVQGNSPAADGSLLTDRESEVR